MLPLKDSTEKSTNLLLSDTQEKKGTTKMNNTYWHIFSNTFKEKYMLRLYCDGNKNKREKIKPKHKK